MTHEAKVKTINICMASVYMLDHRYQYVTEHFACMRYLNLRKLYHKLAHAVNKILKFDRYSCQQSFFFKFYTSFDWIFKNDICIHLPHHICVKFNILT